MKDAVSVSIIIVNYKVKDKLFDCLNSIYNSQLKISFEVIVVDNDEIKTIGRDLKKSFPKVKYIESWKNLGFGAGNNLGEESALGKYLYFLNPDTIVLPKSIDVLYNFLKQNEKVGIVSPLILNNSNDVFPLQGYRELTPKSAIYSFSIFRRFFQNKSIFNNISLDKWNKSPIKEVDCAFGAALMMPSVVFKKVNGFDEHFFLYFEENDLSKRVRKKGFKVFINSNSKIVHEVGQSTKQFSNTQKFFQQSRFYYLKKHYGLAMALLSESIIRTDKYLIFLILAIVLGFFLRIFNIENGMPFIGDQGWFYLSARDLLVYGNIPLVGITSSHTWLHQGPLWTYLLSVFLLIFNFNPVSGAYLTILSGIASIVLIYKISLKLFSRKTGVIASLLFASSPLIVMFDRMPFDPSIIPLFSLLYFYSLVKWIKGKIIFFPITILLLAILYNLELATFTLVFPFALIFALGLWKKKKWVLELKNKKTFIFSLLGFLIPMAPIIIYDFSNGFPQTIVFLGWTLYKPFSFLFHSSSGNLISNISGVVSFLSVSLQKLIFEDSLYLAVLVFLLSLIYLAKLALDKTRISERILLFLCVFSVGGILVNQTPSDAYLPIIFPFIIITVAIFLNFLMSLSRFSIIIIIFIVALNSKETFIHDFSNDLSRRIQAANEIVVLTKGEEYNLIGIGIGSEFKSFTMNYEYLLWKNGNAPSKKDKKTKILIKEAGNEIIIKKYD